VKARRGAGLGHRVIPQPGAAIQPAKPNPARGTRGASPGAGRYALTLAPPGAGQVQDIGTYVVVYRRNAAGQWRAVEDIFNSDAPVLTA